MEKRHKAGQEKVLEYLKKNPKATMSEAKREIGLLSDGHIRKFLRKNFGGLEGWRNAGCPIVAGRDIKKEE